MTTVAPLRPSLTEPVTGPRTAARRTTVRLRLLLGVVATVTLVDQLAKAWAWRHLELVHINSGSGLLFGDRFGSVYRDATFGAAIDGLGAAVLLTLAAVLLQRLRPTTLFVGATLMLAGWASNLGDRLGLHTVTAPGTRRGVVDFLRWHGRLWNVADLTIIAGGAVFTVGLLLLAVGRLRRGRRRRVAEAL